MSLDTLPDRSSVDPEARRAAASDRDAERRRRLPSRPLLVTLVLACATLMVVDSTGGEASPIAPAREAVGEVMGPVEAVADAAVRPFRAVPGALRTNASLREEIAELEAENDLLEDSLRSSGYDAQRVAQLADLRTVAGDLGYALVPTRVVAIGPAQSFAHTVTLDAGRDAGLRPDMTVVNGDGLVGRVTAVTAHTATVRLAVDLDFTVGGRVGENMELGFVKGRGGVGNDSLLDLELVDRAVVPRQGQSVLTWGSEGGAPFVAGVPIGEINQVYSSVRETSYRAEVEPYVDFSALDMVGVVVPSGTAPGRPVIEADGSVRVP